MSDSSSPFVAPWIRSQPPTAGRQCEVAWVVFADAPLPNEVAFVPVRFGIPFPEAITGYQVQEHRRSGDPEWFEQWRSAPAKRAATQQCPAAAAALETAQVCYTIIGSFEDPEDLGHLQGAWALVRWLVERGATAALDVWTGRYRSAEALSRFDPDGPYDITEEIIVVQEPDPRAPDEEHYYYTAGMKKVGRPDVVCAASRDDAAMVGEVLFALARTMYDGSMPASPEHRVTIDPGLTLRLVDPPSPDWGTTRFLLYNEVRVLVDEEGESLGGLSAWWRSQPRGPAAAGAEPE